jgi:hypothetical protein
MTGAEWYAFILGLILFVAAGVFGWSLTRH